MRITKTQLKQIIKEELSALSETSDPLGGPTTIAPTSHDPLGGPTTIAPTSQDSQSATALKQVEQVLANLLKRIQAL
jgi:hypothetical protein